MLNPLWVDARDYLTSQGQPITTGNLNNTMNLLANNPQLRPSAVKGGSAGNAASIAVGLGAPTDDFAAPITQMPVRPEYVAKAVSSSAPSRGTASPSSYASKTDTPSPTVTQTPLPPPTNSSGSPAGRPGGGRQGGPSSHTPSARSTKAPVPVPKPRTVDASDAVGADGQQLSQVNMGGYTPPVPASTHATSPATQSPIPAAQAAVTGETNNTGSDTTNRVLAAVLGALGLGAAAYGMRGGRPGYRPREMPGLNGEVIPPGANPNTPRLGNKPTLEGQNVTPYNGPGNSVTDALPPPAPPRQTYYGSYGQDGEVSVTGDNSPGDPRPFATPGGVIQMPDQSGVIVPPAPMTIEDIIGQLTNQTPPGQSPPGPNVPSGIPPEIANGPRNNSPIGAVRGTRPPDYNYYRGANNERPRAPYAAPPGLPNPIESIMSVIMGQMGGTR